MNSPAIGPVLSATLVTNDYQKTIDAWCDYLHQHVHSETQDNLRLGKINHASTRIAWLANGLDEPWLRIVESTEAEFVNPFEYYGWLSLEINVQNVDELFETLKDSPFEIIGEPADLDVSDSIRAMQVIGPAGEVLYLTEIKAEVPPFELPFARCAVDRLFIPVAMTPSRDDSLALYESFEHTKGIQFDTKITVINRDLGLNIDTRHPVATVQLSGNNLIELDQIDGLSTPDPRQSYCGIQQVSFTVQSLPESGIRYEVSSGPNQGQTAVQVSGPGGEQIEFAET